MGKGSKQKGNSFERNIAKLLEEHHRLPFMRTAHSGAFTGKSNVHRLNSMDKNIAKAYVGDIAPPEGITLVVECKNYATFSGGFHSILNGTSRQLVEWLSEVEYDSKTEIPYMLFFKINNCGSFVVLPEKFFELRDTFDKFEVPFTYFPVEQEEKNSTIHYVVVDTDYYEHIVKDIDKAIRKDYK